MTPSVPLWENVGEDTLEGELFGILHTAAQEAHGQERDRITLAARICRQILEGREVRLP